MTAARPNAAPDPARPGRNSGWRRALLVALLVLAVAAPFVKRYSAQPASRLALTAAIVDDGTIYIDDYRDVTAPIDRIDTGDRLLSDKAPGQPVAAAPVYAIARLVGAEPASQLRLDGNLTLWWVALWSAILPLAAVTAIAFERARALGLRTALPAALSLGLGSMLLPFGTELYGHVLTAALAFWSWTLASPADDGSPSGRRLVVSGALMGAAVAVEYPTALVALVVFVVVATRWRLRSLAWIAGGLPFAAAVMAYQWAAFGSPLRSSYATKSDADVFTSGLPDASTLVEVLVGARGLLLLSPVLLLVPWGIAHGLRQHPPVRREVLVSSAVAVCFLLLQSSWANPWGGEGPGPRYVIPMLPFLVVPLAVAWRHARAFALAATTIGVAMAGLATITFNLIPHGAGYLDTLLDRWRTEGATPTVWTMWLGPSGWLVHALGIAAASWLLWSEARGERAAGSEPQLTPSLGAPASAP